MEQGREHCIRGIGWEDRFLFDEVVKLYHFTDQEFPKRTPGSMTRISFGILNPPISHLSHLSTKTTHPR